MVRSNIAPRFPHHKTTGRAWYISWCEWHQGYRQVGCSIEALHLVNFLWICWNVGRANQIQAASPVTWPRWWLILNAELLPWFLKQQSTWDTLSYIQRKYCILFTFPRRGRRVSSLVLTLVVLKQLYKKRMFASGMYKTLVLILMKCETLLL